MTVATKTNQAHGTPRAMLVHNPALSGCLEIVDKLNHSLLLFPDIPNPTSAIEEHLHLTRTLNQLGIRTIELFDLICHQDKALLQSNPNLIFTRDPLTTIPWLPKIGILGRMKKTVRKHEANVLDKIAHSIGLEKIIHLPEGITFEGGDILPVNIGGKRVLFVRTGGRTSAQALDTIIDHPLGICDEVVELHCEPRVLHLDSMMGFAGDRIVVYEPSAITATFIHSGGQKRPVSLPEYLYDHQIETLSVTHDEANRLQATNYINLDDDSIVAYSNCDRILNELRCRNINVHAFTGHELLKGRGGPRCLTRPIYA